jgi:hypothetical protein
MKNDYYYTNNSVSITPMTSNMKLELGTANTLSTQYMGWYYRNLKIYNTVLNTSSFSDLFYYRFSSPYNPGIYSSGVYKGYLSYYLPFNEVEDSLNDNSYSMNTPFTFSTGSSYFYKDVPLTTVTPVYNRQYLPRTTYLNSNLQQNFCEGSTILNTNTGYCSFKTPGVANYILYNTGSVSISRSIISNYFMSNTYQISFWFRQISSVGDDFIIIGQNSNFCASGEDSYVMFKYKTYIKATSVRLCCIRYPLYSVGLWV